MANGSDVPNNRAMIAGAALIGIAALAILIGERAAPLRRASRPRTRRTVTNIALGALSMAAVSLIESPMTRPLARRAEQGGTGLTQYLPAPGWMRDIAAVLLMDYTVYLWHVATHKVPLLWRFHLVHHDDLDLDASTAIRFHFVDMAISAPYRAAQVALLGVSPRALDIWQSWFFFSVLFHHSNLALPARAERWLARLITTPRMHGIHHSAVKAETDSNWSSGFALWDHLHGTFRLDVPQDDIVIGVPAYRDPDELGLRDSLALPFVAQRDAWAISDRRAAGEAAEAACQSKDTAKRR